ncbi:MAG: rhodanese-related sulfurtransferase [Bacteroidia bacterium]|nr:rhodanese-related sulfurtransferase [Bacteroidia bacterium]
MELYNKKNRQELIDLLMQEPFKRITLSFYRYVCIGNPEIFRNELFTAFNHLKVLGRIYVAHEGVNAQLSVPEFNFEKFRAAIDDNWLLKDVPFKIAVEDDGKSFFKLIVKVRRKIVADGLNDDAFDVTNVGKHLSAEEFNEALQTPDALVIDMRNHYESEVGRFENALCPQADTFRELLPEALEMAKKHKEKKILLYCTGGIRCEKASAYFKHHGFKDVNQLYGGIIYYAHEVKEKKLDSKFIGKNFVFDERLGERITSEVIAHCHQCGHAADTHVNCANPECHLLFIQCPACAEKMKGCCSTHCMEIIALPEEEQRAHRKGHRKEGDRKNIFHPRKGKLSIA